MGRVMVKAEPHHRAKKHKAHHGEENRRNMLLEKTSVDGSSEKSTDKQCFSRGIRDAARWDEEKNVCPERPVTDEEEIVCPQPSAKTAIHSHESEYSANKIPFLKPVAKSTNCKEFADDDFWCMSWAQVVQRSRLPGDTEAYRCLGCQRTFADEFYMWQHLTSLGSKNNKRGNHPAPGQVERWLIEWNSADGSAQFSRSSQQSIQR